MSREKYFAEIEPRIRREAVPVSGPVEFEFPPAKLAVNEIYPESFFNLTIPEAADVVDFSSNAVTSPSRKQQLALPDTTQSQKTVLTRSPLVSQAFFQMVVLAIINLLIVTRWYVRKTLKNSKPETPKNLFEGTHN